MNTKIVFLALHLGYGGAEQAIIAEANVLVEKYDVEIYCLYKLYDEPAFMIDSRVKIRYLTEGMKPNKEELRIAIKKRNIPLIIKEAVYSLKVLYLRKARMRKAIKFSDADIIISTRYLYHRLLTSNAPKKAICIAQEHNHHNNNKKYIQQQLYAIKKMDYFMPVSKELTQFYSERLKDTNVKCMYIPHYLENIPEKNSSLTEKQLISVGRLSPEKGYGELIEIFREVEKKHSDWTLNIIGDGVEREYLQTKIKEYGLENKITLSGFRNKTYIFNEMQQSSIYIMASLTESFGIVLLEAQSCGLPCIAYDSAQGATEIITNGENGILIPNRSREKMLQALERLMNDYEYRVQIGLAGKQNACLYSRENIGKQWYEFIDGV